MKLYRQTFATLVLVLSVLGSSTSFAEKFDAAYKQHCSGFTDHEKCKKRIAKVYRDGCITEQERNQALTGTDGKEIVPICSDDDEIGRDRDYHGWCFCSCFLKGTRIFVEDKATGRRSWEKIEEVTLRRQFFNIVTLSKNATTQDISLDVSEIKVWSSGVENAPIFVLTMDDGSVLTLTGNHSLVLASGYLVDAKDVKVGDTFVNIKNEKVTLVAISQMETKEEVYNVFLKGKQFHSHMLFAETILVGDALFENASEEQVRSVYVGPISH